MGETTVSRLMTSDLFTVSDDTPIEDAADTLLENNIGSLMVVDEENQLTGILTSTDYVDIVSKNKPTDDATVGEYMTTDIVTIGPDGSIRDAAATMISDGIQHLPVEDDDEGVVGMLSATDLTTHLSYLEA
jgi:CBS domain-containing protein